MLINYPPRIRSMIGRIELILGNLSDIQLSISLDGNIGDLPEVQAVKRSLTSSHAEGLLLAIHQAFIAKDLARVNALYSYFILFDESIQKKAKLELVKEFTSYVKSKTSNEEFTDMFLNAGYLSLIKITNDNLLIDYQFNEFKVRFMDIESNLTKRMALIQQKIPLNELQLKEVSECLVAINKKKIIDDQKVSNPTLKWFFLIVIILKLLFHLLH